MSLIVKKLLYIIEVKVGFIPVLRSLRFAILFQECIAVNVLSVTFDVPTYNTEWIRRDCGHRHCVSHISRLSLPGGVKIHDSLSLVVLLLEGSLFPLLR